MQKQNFKLPKNYKIFIIFLILLQFTISDIKIQNKQQNSNSLRYLTQEKSQKNKKQICDLLTDDIKEGEVVSQDQKTSWYYNQQTLKRTRQKNVFEGYFTNDGQNTTEMATQFIYQLFIFVLFFLMSVFGCLGYWFYYCCGCICPPCKLCCNCCRRDRLYTGIDLHWPLLGNGIFLSITFIICLYGLPYSNALEGSFNTFICTGLTALDGLAYGGGSFSGVFGIQQSLSEFSNNQLGILQTETANTFKGKPEWTDLEKIEMDYISDQMKIPCSGGDCVECTGQTYTDPANKPASVVVNCDPNTWVPYIDSYDYITNIDGALQESSIYFSDDIWVPQVNAAKALYQGAVSGISAAITGIEEAGLGINEQQDTMKSALDSAVASMQDLEVTLIDQIDQLFGYHESYNFYMQYVSMGIYYQLILFMIFIFLAFILILFLQLKQWFKLRIFLHFCWMIFSLVMITTFLITIILMTISFSGDQICEIMLKMLNNPDQFQRYSAQLPKDLVDKIMICKKELNLITGPYKGDDNLAKAFGIEDQLQSILDLKIQINNFETEAGINSENMKNLEQVPLELDVILQNIEDLLQTFSTASIDHISLPILMTNINNEMKTCDSYADVYALNKDTQCEGLPLNDFATAGTDPTPYCFYIEDSVDYIPLITTRYTNCGNLESGILQAQAWRNDKNNMTNLKKEQTTDLKQELNMYIDLHKAYITSVTNFNNVALDSINLIAGDNGILNNIKCFWFGQQIDNFYDATCVSFINSCYNTGFVYAIFSFGLFFSSFFIYKYATRMGFNASHIKKIQAFLPPAAELNNSQIDRSQSRKNTQQQMNEHNSKQEKSRLSTIEAFDDNKQETKSHINTTNNNLLQYNSQTRLKDEEEL